MSEPTNEEWKLIAKYFLPAYNSIHKTKYNYSDSKPTISNSDKDFISSEGSVLSVQHTRAVGTNEDIDKEIIRPTKSENFINALMKKLKLNRIDKCHIYINVSNPPKNNQEIQEAVYWISDFIIKQSNNKIKNQFFSFNQEDYDIYVQRCKKWISELDLLKIQNFLLGLVGVNTP